VGFAVMKDPFGEGAERIVYEMTEIDVNKQPVGDRFVAKDSKFVLEKQTMGRGFHQSFVKTQRKAAKVAKKFNAALDRHGISHDIPRVEVLSCSI